MKRIKVEKPYKTEVTLDQILAYVKDKPETHTHIELVNAVCDLFADPKVLAEGKIADRLGVDSRHLAFTLELLTGHNTSAIRAELIADRWRKEQKRSPGLTEDQLARRIGFADGSSLIHFMQRNKRRFPELYLQEEEQYNRMAPIVEKLMPEASNIVRRVFIRLPYQGSQEEKEACLKLLYRHGRKVANLAKEIALRHPSLFPDLDYVERCALLHNVGIIHTDMPQLHCYGKQPYIRHGQEGFEILSRFRGLRLELFAAKEHIGSGISFDEIQEKNLHLIPAEPEQPICKLICYASSFYSIFKPDRKRTIEEIRQNLSQYSDSAVKRFDALHLLFSSAESGNKA